MAADDQGTGSLMQVGGQTEQQQLVAGARTHCPPSTAATSRAAAPGPVSHGDHVSQSRRGGGGGSDNVNGSCSSLSRGSSILCLSDLSSTLQADQEGGSIVGLDEGAAALPALHVDLPTLPQDGMHTIKVGLGLGFSGYFRTLIPDSTILLYYQGPCILLHYTDYYCPDTAIIKQITKVFAIVGLPVLSLPLLLAYLFVVTTMLIHIFGPNPNP